jgi:hypothetical protein
MSKALFKEKMALLGQIDVSFCNIETGYDNSVRFFTIFYA